MENKPDDALLKQIHDLVPATLDEVIRKNRHLAELGLSTPAEIQRRAGDLAGELEIKDTLDDWRLISMREKTSGQVSILVLGDSQKENTPWLTSAVVWVDSASHRVLTWSKSIYQLGSPGAGEPPRQHLIHLCATFHQWGNGEFLDVPHFFY